MTRSAATPLEVIAGLQEVDETLGRLIEQHREANLGTILPHVMLGEVAIWAAAEVQKHAQGDRTDRVGAVVAYLEDLYRSGNSDVRELIAVSFVELLPSTGRPGAEVRNLLGPHLRAEYQRLNG